MSVSSLRWPRTCTTCWSTTDTSWTVAVLLRWRGRGRWPLTSSPVAPRAVNTERGSSVTPTALTQQRTAETLRGQFGNERRSTVWWTQQGQEETGLQSPAWPAYMMSQTQTHTCRTLSRLFPKLLKRSWSPVALERKCYACVMSNSMSISSGVYLFLCRWIFVKNLWISKTCYLKKICKDEMKDDNDQRTNVSCETHKWFFSKVQWP